MWPGGPDIGAANVILGYAVFVFITPSTTYGRSVFAIVGNARAAMLTGINVTRTRVILFATSGLMAAILGIILRRPVELGLLRGRPGP